MKRIALLLACLLFASAPAASAADYPTRPIRVVIPFGPGSGTDAVLRVLAPVLSESLGQPIVIDPRPGADGAISASEVARAAPDGYTLGIGTGGPLAAVPALRSNPPYDVLRDFTPITDIGRYTVFMFISTSVPAASFTEFVGYVKANPEKVSYATGNPSGIVAWSQINSLLGLRMLHVPYRSAPQILPDLLSGRVHAIIDSPVVAMPHVRDGKLRPLVTTLSRRSPLLPDVPSIHEAGVPGFTIANWMGLVGPAKMPRELVERLNREFGAALAKPEVRAALEKQAFVPSPSTPEQFGAFISEQIQSYEKLLRAAGVPRD
ncbi:MAG: Bug family tripartite tricarboxylate transporter substrate binding protein [Burkholderiaceae bacterium]